MLFRASRRFASVASFAALAALAVASSGVFTACSSSPATPQVGSGDGGSGDGGGCQAFVPPSTFSATSPTVSFSKDVLPILESGCAFSSCHGNASAPQGGMYLGANAAETYAAIVNATALDYPSMVRVKPGDVANSYLLHRIDNDACTLSGCTSVACAELMPQGGPALGQADRLTIRGWVAQGALSDVADAGPSGPDSGTTGDAGTDAAPVTDANVD